MSRFSLIPFEPNTAPPVEITGNILRNDNQLEIKCLIQERSPIIIPATANQPTRQFDLWEHTCLEFFLGIRGSSQYWEFNLSPSGNWNVFRFLDYRLDIAEEMTFNKLPFQVSLQDNSVRVKAKVDLDKIIAPEQSLDAGVTAVIEDNQKQLSYWALSHPGKEADFHLRDSFVVSL